MKQAEAVDTVTVILRKIEWKFSHLRRFVLVSIEKLMVSANMVANNSRSSIFSSSLCFWVNILYKLRDLIDGEVIVVSFNFLKYLIISSFSM